MRIIIEFDAAQNPVIRLEQAHSQSGAHTGSPQPVASSQSGTTDAGAAPAGAAADNSTGPSMASSMLMSGSQQSAFTQAGAADGGPAFSAGSPSIAFNNNGNS